MTKKEQNAKKKARGRPPKNIIPPLSEEMRQQMTVSGIIMALAQSSPKKSWNYLKK